MYLYPEWEGSLPQKAMAGEQAWGTPGAPDTSFSYKYLSAIEQYEASLKSIWQNVKEEVFCVNKEAPSSSRRLGIVETEKLDLT